MSITFRGGRRPPHSEDARPRLHLGPFLTGTYPKPPVKVDYVSAVDEWPMYGNDQYGDCVWAMIGHTIEAATAYGQGRTVKVSEADVLRGYSDVTGFDPVDPSTDQGTVIQDALDYWRKTGVGGHQILAFAQVDIHDPGEVDAALWLFGHLQLGINFPAVAMDQFDAGQPWDVVKNDGGIEGGHAIDLGYVLGNPPQLVGRAANGNYRIITWGRVQEMTPAFWGRYVEEAWVVVTPEWISQKGTSPEGLDVAALGEAFTAMTGEPNPFPVQPAPGPAPGPSPAPVDVADQALADAVRPWLRLRHRGTNADAARALKTWLTAKGL
ncbi:hypothetical protein GCM10023196_035410 [Actinoallomurus vinaceus]|uniref:Lysin A n=1 Tax=Actinoallomurus vinaceus TaxID=1080074 RepID=A0ABP8U913_9ACTN